MSNWPLNYASLSLKRPRRLPREAPEVSFSPAALRKTAGEMKISATIDVPTGYRQARVSVLLEPDQEVRSVKAEATDTGRPIALSAENGGRGVWYWYWVDLSPGKHTVDLTIHSSTPAHVSAWLLTRRTAGPMPAQNLALPAQNVDRGTHLLLEETIR